MGGGIGQLSAGMRAMREGGSVVCRERRVASGASAVACPGAQPAAATPARAPAGHHSSTCGPAGHHSSTHAPASHHPSTRPPARRLSPELAALLGLRGLHSLPFVMQALWAYCKRHRLHDVSQEGGVGVGGGCLLLFESRASLCCLH